MSTIQSALTDAKKRMQPASESAVLDAQLLLCHVLGVERAYLLAHPERVLTADEESRFAALVERGAAGEPLAYILGKRAFYDRDFAVSPAVLIPRPETEQLLELALNFARSRSSLNAVDVGTGSGALAVTFAAHCPQAAVYATDISPAALDIARQNAATHQVNIQFLQGDLLTPLIERNLQVELIMANLPYIAHDEMLNLAVSRYEPHLALDGGADGLDLVRRLLDQSHKVWNADGLMLLEIGADQGTAAQKLVQEAYPNVSVEVLKDFAGLDRIVRFGRK